MKTILLVHPSQPLFPSTLVFPRAQSWVHFYLLYLPLRSVTLSVHLVFHINNMQMTLSYLSLYLLLRLLTQVNL